MIRKDFLAGIPAAERPDAIYFLMIVGWREELRSNRWHWARRWAKHIPVILVQPETFRSKFDISSEKEARIPNTRILSVRSVARKTEEIAIFSALQTAQIMTDAYMAGYKNPWVWCFNPFLAVSYSLLPFRKKIMHLTEDWFLWPNRLGLLWDEVKAGLWISDLVIAVSEGVSESAKEKVENMQPLVITNGCDFADYSSGVVDSELGERGKAFGRIAVFGGNINSRIDYPFLLGLVEKNPNTLFAIVGPKHKLSDQDEEFWSRISKKENCFAPGLVEPERLADIYTTGNIGILPFKMEDLYVKSQFSLKLLEMAATGLPVVTTYMKAIDNLGVRNIKVTRTAEEFMTAFPRLDRKVMKEEERVELLRLARRNDYDVKFGEAMSELENRHRSGEANGCRVDQAVHAGLLDKEEGNDLAGFVGEYARRPTRRMDREKEIYGRIAVPLLTANNKIGAELLRLRKKAEEMKNRVEE